MVGDESLAADPEALEDSWFNLDEGTDVEVGVAPNPHNEYVVVANRDGTIASTQEVFVSSSNRLIDAQISGEDCPDQ